MRTAPLVEVHISNSAAREVVPAHLGDHRGRRRDHRRLRPGLLPAGAAAPSPSWSPSAPSRPSRDRPRRVHGRGQDHRGPAARRAARPAVHRQRPGHRGSGPGAPIRQIFADDGEPAFRALEHQVIAGLLDGPDAVLALGGGAVEHPGTRRHCWPPPRSSTCGSATTRRWPGSAATRAARCWPAPTWPRPTSAGYRSTPAVATLTVPTDGRPAEAVSQDILARLVSQPAAGAPGSVCPAGALAVSLSHAHRDDAQLHRRLRRDGGRAGRLRAGRPGHRVRGRGCTASTR